MGELPLVTQLTGALSYVVVMTEGDSFAYSTAGAPLPKVSLCATFTCARDSSKTLA